jgi:hypothetical protein
MLLFIRRARERAPRSEKARPDLPFATADEGCHEGCTYDFAVWWGEQARLLPERYPFDRIPCGRLIEAYAEFCNAYGLRPMSDVALLRRIKSAGFQAYRESTGKRRRFYRVA